MLITSEVSPTHHGTMFQLMRATCYGRAEAQKLFFSVPVDWYRIEAELLLRRSLIDEPLYRPRVPVGIQ